MPTAFQEKALLLNLVPEPGRETKYKSKLHLIRLIVKKSTKSFKIMLLPLFSSIVTRTVKNESVIINYSLIPVVMYAEMQRFKSLQIYIREQR